MQSTSSVLHPTSWKKETGNWLKTEQDKANQILTTKETLYLITDYDSSVLHPTSWKKETGNWLKTEQDKANQILSTKDKHCTLLQTMVHLSFILHHEKKETGNWLKTEQDKANHQRQTLYLITDYEAKCTKKKKKKRN